MQPTVRRFVEVAAAFSFEMLQIVSALVIFKLVAGQLGPDQYGIYITLYVVSGMAMIWVWACATSAVIQLLLQKQRTVESAMRVARRRIAVLSAPAAAIALAVSVAVLHDDDVWKYALIVLATDLVVTGLAESNLAVVFAFGGTVSTSRLRAVLPIAKTVGVVLLALADQISIMSLVLNNLVAACLLLALSRPALARSHRLDPVVDRTPTDRRELNSLARLYGTSMATNAIQDQGDKIALAWFRTPAEVGEYGAAYRVVSLAFLPLHALNIAANRWFLARDDRVGTHLRKAIKLMVPTAAYGLVCAIGILLAKPIIERLVGPKFDIAGDISSWLCLFPLARGAADVPVMGLLGLGQNRARMWLGLCGMAVAAGAYLAMIPEWGWKGAVFGTYLSELFVVAAGWMLLVVCQRRSDRAPRSAADAAPDAADLAQERIEAHMVEAQMFEAQPFDELSGWLPPAGMSPWASPSLDEPGDAPSPDPV